MDVYIFIKKRLDMYTQHTRMYTQCTLKSSGLKEIPFERPNLFKYIFLCYTVPGATMNDKNFDLSVSSYRNKSNESVTD